MMGGEDWREDTKDEYISEVWEVEGNSEKDSTKDSKSDGEECSTKRESV